MGKGFFVAVAWSVQELMPVHDAEHLKNSLSSSLKLMTSSEVNWIHGTRKVAGCIVVEEF